MTLIVILISLVVEKFLLKIENYRRLQWITTYFNWSYLKLKHNPVWDSPLGVIVSVFPILILWWILFSVLHDIHGIFSFLFGLLTLVMCLGPINSHEKIRSYIESNKDDKSNTLNDVVDTSIPDGPLLYRSIIQSILIHTGERILSVLFWFILLGPIGALLFRTSCLLRDFVKREDISTSEFAQYGNRLYFLMQWIPSRLTALSYAISGSFVHALENWHNISMTVNNISQENDVILVNAGIGALQFDTQTSENTQIEHIETTLSLTWRSVIVWITVLAVITLAGWIT